jgi:NAD-dependent DNA ligase
LNISYQPAPKKTEEKKEGEEGEDDEDEEKSASEYPLLVDASIAFSKIDRDPELLAFLKLHGAKKVDCNVTKSTTCLIVKSHEDDSNKFKNAKKFGISIVMMDEFAEKYLGVKRGKAFPWG